MAKTSGMRRYFGAESGNVLLGQLGFDVISTAGTSTATAGAGDFTDVNCWVTILSLNDASSVSATSSMGDGLTTQIIKDGIAVSGVFTTVTCAGTNGVFLAYRG